MPCPDNGPMFSPSLIVFIRRRVCKSKCIFVLFCFTYILLGDSTIKRTPRTKPSSFRRCRTPCICLFLHSSSSPSSLLMFVVARPAGICGALCRGWQQMVRPISRLMHLMLPDLKKKTEKNHKTIAILMEERWLWRRDWVRFASCYTVVCEVFWVAFYAYRFYFFLLFFLNRFGSPRCTNSHSRTPHA